MLLLPLFLLLAGEVREFPGAKEIPHEAYIHGAPESVSPISQVYIKSKDGLYVAAAIRKPRGAGPFPVLVHFHGAPGGRGMEQLTGWARGDHGSPTLERFLKEGCVLVVADYRGGQNFQRMHEPYPDSTTYADDAAAVIEYLRKQPYVNADRISVYGVSLGGDVVMHLLTRTKLHRAVLGAPAPVNFLGARANLSPAAPEERFKGAAIDTARAAAAIAKVETPVLIQVGTADSLIHLDRILHDQLDRAGKRVRLEIYGNGYHDFVMGPQGQAGRKEPLLDITLQALESAVQWILR